MFSDFIQGFLIELTLIIAVGMQNAFILKQGLGSRYVFTAVIVCWLGETLLVTVGVAGMGAILNSKPQLIKVVIGLGICFLTFYSIKSFIAAFKADIKLETAKNKNSVGTFWGVVTTALGFALLNPHALIDTTLMGALSSKFYPHQWIFWGGVVTAALVWYVFLGTLGKLLAKQLDNPKTWRVINVGVGVLCAYMAVTFAINLNEPHGHDESPISIGIFDNIHKHK